MMRGAPVIPLSSKDIDILRRLAEEQAKIAALPVHTEKAELWRRLNQLEPVRPMVWINEIPWHEMDVNAELTLQTSHPWAQTVEQGLRRLLYQWRHMPADMIVDDYIACPKIILTTGYGMKEDVDIVRTDDTSDIISRRFHPQIVEPEDVAKIQDPVVTYDAQATQENFETMKAIFDGILPVRLVGKKGIWFAPWDELIRWWGVEDAMRDLVDRPEMVQALISRVVEAHLSELDQWVALNLLTLNNDNTRIGSGGYGHTSELPGEPFDPQYVKPHNNWGCATAQIFSAVSPRMHWEFALQHELRWLERWGLTYYGCCEPLDIKMGVLRRIPNLRKVSMSPWVDLKRAAALVQDDYVFSRKPNPAVLAEDDWRLGQAEQDLRELLEKTRGCRLEIILKDISTVRYHPERLWAWEKMAMRMVGQ
jgi:hypothetical protein